MDVHARCYKEVQLPYLVLLYLADGTKSIASSEIMGGKLIKFLLIIFDAIPNG